MDAVYQLFRNKDTTNESTEQFDLDTLLVSIEAAARIANQTALILDFDSQKLIYKTRHLIFLEEATEHDQQRECENPYWSLITDETLDELLLIKEKYPVANKDISLDEYRNHICTLNYPILIRGREVYLTQLFTPLYIRNDGTTRIGLFIIRYSNRKKLESCITIPGGKRLFYDTEKHVFVRHGELVLSNAEKAVLQRAEIGMSIEEIAESLFVTVNTVKTHRSRIFRKLNVKSIAEAIAVIRNHNV